MPAVQHTSTVADLRRVREEYEAQGHDRVRVELVDGEIVVTPAPRTPHQRAVRELGRLLYDYVEANGLGEVFPLEVDYVVNERNSYLPDLSVVPFVDGKPLKSWDELGRPLLAAEVLSPSTARRDRLNKRANYLAAGVAEYWIIDLDGRVIERWRPGDERPEIVAERLAWHPDAASAALEIDLPAFFARSWGE